MLEEVSQSALIIRFVKRACANVESQRDSARRFGIPPDCKTHPVFEGSKFYLGINRDIAVLVGPLRRLSLFCVEKGASSQNQEERKKGEVLCHGVGWLVLQRSLQ